jgi:CelD/BcsL family acetyltransferase involved in cellulose biosynthesis
MTPSTVHGESSPPRPAPTPLTTTVLHSFDDLAPLAAEWDAAALAAGSTVYMSYDWLRTWWQFYGAGHDLHLLLFRSDNRLAGMLPVYVQTLGRGSRALRVARLVGANIPPKVFDPPVPQELAPEIFDLLLNHLFGPNPCCDYLSFGPFSDLHRPSFELAEAARRFRSQTLATSQDADDVHTVFLLPQDMEAYFASLSKNERKNRRKYELRTLEKDYQVREDCIADGPELAAEFDAFAAQHARQWAEQGKPGHFGSWPRALDYNRALVQAQARQGRVRILRILANDQVVSRQYAFAWGQSLDWELPSREVDGPWERFSLGPSGIVRMIAYAIQNGFTRIEGGLSHYDYKIRLGASEHPVHTTRIFVDNPQTRAKVAAWSKRRQLVRLLYHKIWYRRIQPRLPAAFRKPQPLFWLHLDF